MLSGNTRNSIGRQAEQMAEEYLAGHGLRVLARNYRCRGGELDLVMSDGQTLIFIEVRYRKHRQFGGAAASVDRRKQQRLILAAQHYLQRHGVGDKPCRFDVVALDANGADRPHLQWFRNAFVLE